MELSGQRTIPIKGGRTAPSLLYNNLSVAGSTVAYVHKGEVVLADITKTDSPHVSHPLGEKTGVHQVKLTPTESRLVMIVAMTNEVQFWDADKESLLCVCPTVSGDVYLSRGIGVLPGKGDTATVFLGHSSGALSVIDYQGSSCSLAKSLQRHADCVSDVCAGEADAGVVIVSADIGGEMVLWSEDLSETGTASFQGDTLTSAQLVGVFVAASFGSGVIRLYSVKGCSVFCEIRAHARWVTGMAVLPDSSLVASVSEDMLLSVWRAPCKSNGGKVQLVGHRLLQDCLLTGVQFSDDGRHIYAAAYDWDRLYVFDTP